MTKMTLIDISLPRRRKILVPYWVFEELEQKVKEENFNEIITEALIEELKKVRFRLDLEKSLRQADLTRQTIGKEFIHEDAM